MKITANSTPIINQMFDPNLLSEAIPLFGFLLEKLLKTLDEMKKRMQKKVKVGSSKYSSCLDVISIIEVHSERIKAKEEEWKRKGKSFSEMFSIPTVYLGEEDEKILKRAYRRAQTIFLD